MQLFEQYEEDLKEQLADILSKINGIPNFEPVKRAAQVRGIEGEIQDAEETIRKLSLSAKQVTNNISLQTRVKNHENELNKLKATLRKAELNINAQSDRAELFSGLKEDMMASSLDQRARLLDANDRLDRSTNVLKGSITTALETVTIAEGTMNDLEDQGQRMRGIRDRLDGVNLQLGKARKILGTMGRRAITNKLIMALIIIVLLAAVVLIVYMKWFSNTSSTADQVSSTGSQPVG